MPDYTQLFNGALKDLGGGRNFHQTFTTRPEKGPKRPKEP